MLDGVGGILSDEESLSRLKKLFYIDRPDRPMAFIRLRLSTKRSIQHQRIILKLELLKTIFGWIIC